jgi:hypothetical protein
MIAADPYRRKSVGVFSEMVPNWATKTLLVHCGFALGGDSMPTTAADSRKDATPCIVGPSYHEHCGVHALILRRP